MGGLPSRTQKTRPESLWGKLKDWYTDHKPTSQIQTFWYHQIHKQGDVQLILASPKATEHLTPFGAKLAEKLNNTHNTERTLHVLHCATALMDSYKFPWNLELWCS